MTILLIVLGALLCAAVTASALGKLRGMPQVVQTLTHVGLTPGQIRALGVVMLLGVLGIVAGIWVPMLGVLAALGLVLYFAGGVIAHLRVKDPIKDAAPALGLGVLSLIVLVLELMR